MYQQFPPNGVPRGTAAPPYGGSAPIPPAWQHAAPPPPFVPAQHGGPPPPPAPRRGRRGLVALVAVLVVVALAAAGATLWFTAGRDEAVAQLAIGTWSCRGLAAPDEAPVEAIVGTSTFAVPRLGLVGTWRLDDGRLDLEVLPTGPERRTERVSTSGVPEQATPRGAVVLAYVDTDSSKQLQWSYEDGRVTFSAPGGELDVNQGEEQRPVRPIGECTKVR